MGKNMWGAMNLDVYPLLTNLRLVSLSLWYQKLLKLHLQLMKNMFLHRKSVPAGTIDSVFGVYMGLP